MKPPLSDTLVICDMDNTLLTAKEGIPACNRAVIQLYTGMGGLFTVATGRPPESIRAALGNIRLSLPAISCNGALLYDFSAESVLHRSTLNREQATTAILDILNKFPHIGVEVMAGNGEMFVIHANEVTHAHQVDEHLGSIACPVESVPDGWVKVVFASDPESIRKLGQYAKTRYYGRENYFLATNSIYLEIMPSGVSKASGLHDLCALMSKSMKNTALSVITTMTWRSCGSRLRRGCRQRTGRGQGCRRPCDDLHLRRGRSGGVSVQPDRQSRRT